jgi:hypothetical protein
MKRFIPVVALMIPSIGISGNLPAIKGCELHPSSNPYSIVDGVKVFNGVSLSDGEFMTKDEIINSDRSQQAPYFRTPKRNGPKVQQSETSPLAYYKVAKGYALRVYESESDNVGLDLTGQGGFLHMSVEIPYRLFCYSTNPKVDVSEATLEGGLKACSRNTEEYKKRQEWCQEQRDIARENYEDRYLDAQAQAADNIDSICSKVKGMTGYDRCVETASRRANSILPVEEWDRLNSDACESISADEFYTLCTNRVEVGFANRKKFKSAVAGCDESDAPCIREAKLGLLGLRVEETEKEARTRRSNEREAKQLRRQAEKALEYKLAKCEDPSAMSRYRALLETCGQQQVNSREYVEGWKQRLSELTSITESSVREGCHKKHLKSELSCEEQARKELGDDADELDIEYFVITCKTATKSAANRVDTCINDGERSLQESREKIQQLREQIAKAEQRAGCQTIEEMVAECKARHRREFDNLEF